MPKDKKQERMGETNYNNQGCLMKIIEYTNNKDITVEFQDEYKSVIHTTYHCFVDGGVKNPYYPSVYGVGIIGSKYPVNINGEDTKEYQTWKDILRRCFTKSAYHTYRDVICCKEWLLFENFYEWLYSQKNFEKWFNGKRWAIDKDILIKGNKVYSPETCCLVPYNINFLFLKSNAIRGDLPIGVSKDKDKFRATCNLYKQKISLGTYKTPEEAFQKYKEYKEKIIKQVAETEYSNENITEKCYQAMINYTVEITD